MEDTLLRYLSEAVSLRSLWLYFKTLSFWPAVSSSCWISSCWESSIWTSSEDQVLWKNPVNEATSVYKAGCVTDNEMFYAADELLEYWLTQLWGQVGFFLVPSFVVISWFILKSDSPLVSVTCHPSSVLVWLPTRRFYLLTIPPVYEYSVSIIYLCLMSACFICSLSQLFATVFAIDLAGTLSLYFNKYFCGGLQLRPEY